MFLLAFPLSYLNPILAVLHVSGIPSLWQPLGIPTQLSFYAGKFFNLLILTDWAFFLFLPSFLIGFKACPFIAFGLQAFWAYHLFLGSLSMAPCVISLGLGVVIEMVNVGWWNHRERLAPSIFRVKGDLET